MEAYFTSLTKRQTMLLLTAVTFGGNDALLAFEHLPDDESKLLGHHARGLLEIPREKRIPLLVAEMRRMVMQKRTHGWGAEPERLAEVLRGERPALVEVLLRALPAALATGVRVHLPPRPPVTTRRDIKPEVLTLVRWKLDEIFQRALAPKATFRFVDLKNLAGREVLTVVDRLGLRSLGPALAGLPDEARAELIAGLPPQLEAPVQKALEQAQARKLLPDDAVELVALHRGTKTPLDAVRSAGAQRLVRACMAQSPDFCAAIVERFRPDVGPSLTRWFREEKARTIQRGDGGRMEVVVELEQLAERGLLDRPVRLPPPQRPALPRPRLSAPTRDPRLDSEPSLAPSAASLAASSLMDQPSVQVSAAAAAASFPVRFPFPKDHPVLRERPALPPPPHMRSPRPPVAPARSSRSGGESEDPRRSLDEREPSLSGRVPGRDEVSRSVAAGTLDSSPPGGRELSRSAAAGMRESSPPGGRELSVPGVRPGAAAPRRDMMAERRARQAGAASARQAPSSLEELSAALGEVARSGRGEPSLPSMTQPEGAGGRSLAQPAARRDEPERSLVNSAGRRDAPERSLAQPSGRRDEPERSLGNPPGRRDAAERSQANAAGRRDAPERSPSQPPGRREQSPERSLSHSPGRREDSPQRSQHPGRREQSPERSLSHTPGRRENSPERSQPPGRREQSPERSLSHAPGARGETPERSLSHSSGRREETPERSLSNPRGGRESPERSLSHAPGARGESPERSLSHPSGRRDDPPERSLSHPPGRRDETPEGSLSNPRGGRGEFPERSLAHPPARREEPPQRSLSHPHGGRGDVPERSLSQPAARKDDAGRDERGRPEPRRSFERQAFFPPAPERKPTPAPELKSGESIRPTDPVASEGGVRRTPVTTRPPVLTGRPATRTPAQQPTEEHTSPERPASKETLRPPPPPPMSNPSLPAEAAPPNKGPKRGR